MYLVRLIRSGVLARAFAGLACAALLALSPMFAAAQQRSEAWALETARSAFFHLDVKGTPYDATDPLQNTQRHGKAFAIGSELLVTAQHVVGDQGQRTGQRKRHSSASAPRKRGE